MFRFENNMPYQWVNESRDFQLLLRLDDTLFMGQRADIATMQNLNASPKCKDILLDLLAKKVGFFTNKSLEENALRNIICAFRLAVRNKGTKKGIFYAVTAVLKAENSTDEPRIDIDNTDKFEINIYTPIAIQNIDALKEFLKYVVPAGFSVNIYSYTANVPVTYTNLNNIDTILAGNLNIKTLSEIKNKYSDSDNAILKHLVDNYAGGINSGIISSLENINSKSQESAIKTISNKGIETGITLKGN